MNRLKLLLALAGASLLAACASTPTPYTEPGPRAAATKPAVTAPASAQASAQPEVSAQTHLNRALDLLHHGDPQAARVELTGVLAQLDDPTAKLLMEQIDRDPRALLGERNFSYKMRPGESLSSLAGRFLGDPLLFYALARYNGIETPDDAEPGRVLLIPGGAKKAAPAAPNVAAKAAPAAPAANPARASDLRRRALDDMSKGSVDLAVALLEQAEPLDPNNPLIRNDLDRALRIQASLKRR